MESKTALAILHEFCTTEDMVLSFDLIIESSGPSPIFTYLASAGDYSAKGTGYSKQQAKQASAQQLLNILSEKNYHLKLNITSMTAPISHNKEGSDFSVGDLTKYCLDNNYPDAVYDLESEEGPPHLRVFNIKCTVSNIIELGSANSKKQAKHKSAAAMLSRLKQLSSQEHSAIVKPKVDKLSSLNTIVGSKTPVSLLYEYCATHKLVPLFNIIQSNEPTALFNCRVSIGNDFADGSGSTKLQAKHASAQQFLNNLQPGINIQDLSSQQENNKIVHIAIGDLNLYCANKNYPDPVYDFVSENGHPHARVFKYKCAVSNITEFGSADTKKQAKHLAAAGMLSRLKQLSVNEQTAIIKPKVKSEHFCYNDKTPVALLYEYCTRKNSVPSFDLTHQSLLPSPLFTYRVSVGQHFAEGSGGTKQQAKQTGSKQLLDRLKEIESNSLVISPDREVNQVPLSSNLNEHSDKNYREIIKEENNTVLKMTEQKVVDVKNKGIPLQHLNDLTLLSVGKNNAEAIKDEKDIKFSEHKGIQRYNISGINAVGELINYCTDMRYPEAIYEFFSEEGPPQLRVFTIKCTVSNITEYGLGTTKKQAKHQSAYAMIIKLKQSKDLITVKEVEAMPQSNLIKPNNNCKVVNFMDDKMTKQYFKKLGRARKLKPTSNYIADDFNNYAKLALKSQTAAKLSENKDLIESSSTLDLIAKELGESLIITQESGFKKLVVFVCLNVKPKLYGAGYSVDEAKSSALNSLYFML